MKPYRLQKVIYGRYDVYSRAGVRSYLLGHLIKVHDGAGEFVGWQPYDADDVAIDDLVKTRTKAADIVYARAYNTYRADPANN